MDKKIIFQVDEENQGFREELNSADELKAKIEAYLDERTYMVSIKKRAETTCFPSGPNE